MKESLYGYLYSLFQILIFEDLLSPFEYRIERYPNFLAYLNIQPAFAYDYASEVAELTDLLYFLSLYFKTLAIRSFVLLP